jgi:uncharacterized membrane protein YbhN (UPF0104 family)
VSETDDGPPAAPPVSPRRIGSVLRVLRLACGALLFVFVAVAAYRNWDEVRTTIARIGPAELVGSEVLVLAGLALSVLTWRRAVLEVGTKVRVSAAAKIYLVGQLGKYVPGSFWALAAQAELGRDAGVARSRGLAASLVALGVNVVTGLALGLALVPTVTDGVRDLVAAATFVALLALALNPPVLTRLVDLGLRLVSRPALDRRITWRGIAVAIGLSVAGWLAYGLSLWCLVVSAGAPAREALPLCLAGMPLAMTAGFLVIVAPSGIGVREAVLVATLAPVLDRSDALAVALVSRLVFTVGDLAAAAVTTPVRARPLEGA